MIGFLILLVFDTLAQVSFKLAGTNTHPSCDLTWIARVACDRWTYGAVLGYVGAFITWMTLLKHAPIGPAFAATHLHVVTVAIFSFRFLASDFRRCKLSAACLSYQAFLFLLTENKKRTK